ncbi:MAG: GNAT family N-acetyltransferase [Phormidesmis sp.]
MVKVKDDYTLRALERQDEAVLWEMLMYAAHESSVATVRDNPDLTRYVQGWGRSGDIGIVAMHKDKSVGAAWLRLWSGSEKGYGYVADEIPELAIAMGPNYQGQGIGSALLTQILAMAQNKFPAVSLSTRVDNPATRLYQRTGFVRVPETEVGNRTGGVSVTMIYNF